MLSLSYLMIVLSRFLTKKYPENLTIKKINTNIDKNLFL